MGVFGGAGNVWYDGTERGKEIYDPVSDGWYWLDAVYDGAKAEGKEVFMPYIYGNENELDPETKADLAYESNTAEENIEHAKLGYQIKMAMLNGTGKWVRYDENGKMLKGWVRIEGALEEKYPGQAGNVYYYDRRTGVMAKGIVEIDGKHYEFDRTFGTLIGETSEPTDEEAEATKTTDEEAEATKTTYYDWFMKSVETTTPEGIVTDKYEFEKDERGRTIKSVFYSTLCSLDKDGSKHDYEKPDKPDEIEDIFVPNYPTDAVKGQQFSYIESQEYDGDMNPTSIMKIIDEYYEYTVEE